VWTLTFSIGAAGLQNPKRSFTDPFEGFCCKSGKHRKCLYTESEDFCREYMPKNSTTHTHTWEATLESCNGSEFALSRGPRRSLTDCLRNASEACWMTTEMLVTCLIHAIVHFTCNKALNPQLLPGRFTAAHCSLITKDGLNAEN